MSYLKTVAEAEAEGGVAELYAADHHALGRVANYTKAFSARPDVYRAWRGLNGAIKASMDARRYEVATVAAARVLKSSYCALAHGSVLAGLAGEPAVRQLLGAQADSELTESDLAIAELATKVATDASTISEDDFDHLRALGFTDPEILDVVLAAAARCFFSTVLDATGTLPDAAYSSGLDPETLSLLTVGRPIEASG
jgi:uncharacterized peroxidase-related enzyme